MENIKILILNYVNKLKPYFFIIVLLILLYLLYRKINYYSRTNSIINAFENNFIKNNIKHQLDFCHGKYERTNLCDFYINSSFLPYLTGFQKYDYSNYDMFQKSIEYGARYIELQIYNKEIKTNTDPIISSGNEKGTQIDLQNSLDAKKCFMIIAEYAFSERSIDNYQDPFIIFLDFRTGNNYRTLDKLYDIIKNILGHKLLDESYNFENKNIATTDICKLMNKVVIFSNTNYEHSKIKEIVNMSTNSSYLKRILYNQLPINEDLVSSLDEPLVSLKSTKININKNIITIEDETNFIDLGIETSNMLKINGTEKKIPELLTIKQVTYKSILLDDNVDLNIESAGNSIQLKIFDQSYTFKNLHEQNKNAITIVSPSYNFFVHNSNPYEGWKLGCQIVCMNFQSIDNNLKINMKKFKNQSYILKPSNLRNYIEPNKSIKLNSLYPEYQDLDIPIQTDFKENYIYSYITPFNNEKLRIINDNSVKLSPSFTSENSIFDIEDALDGTYGGISIKNGTKYLCSSNNGCYLKFLEFSNIDKKNATFIPVESLCNDKSTISFLQIKDETKYYIKYRSTFNYKTRIYTKKTKDYKYITTLKSKNGDVKIWEPKNNELYKNIGHIASGDDSIPKKETILYKGAVSNPMDFKLLFQNDQKTLSIWKMIPPNGYVALGIVFTKGIGKPIKTNYVCIAIEYTDEIELGSNIWKNDDTFNKLSLWNTADLNYIITGLSYKKPSEFTNPVYSVIKEEKDYMDRLFMGKVKLDELESACFKVYNEKTKKALRKKYSIKNINKENKQIISKHGEPQCISLKNSYWGLNSNNESKLELSKCPNEDTFDSNWLLNKDETIRLEKKIDQCITIKNNKLVLDKCRHNDYNQKFTYSSSDKNNSVLMNINNETKDFKCIENKNGELVLSNCEDKIEQKWIIDQDIQYLCLQKGSVIYYKYKIKRGENKYFGSRKNNMKLNNYLNEYADQDHFHIYLKGIIEDETNNNWKIKFSNGSEKTLNKNSKLILYSIPNISTLKKGVHVLCKNGGLLKTGYNEDNVMWKATILNVLSDERYNILFSINSIEANLNKNSLGRPRENIAKIVDVNDLILFKSALKC